MKRIVLKLSRGQFKELDEITGYSRNILPFALLAQPLMSNKTLSVLIMDESEYKRMGKFMRRFVPKELRSKIEPPIGGHLE